MKRIFEEENSFYDPQDDYPAESFLCGDKKGERCNRGGCDGILDEHEKGDCTCHLKPPCESCCTDTTFCPTCGYEAAEE